MTATKRVRSGAPRRAACAPYGALRAALPRVSRAQRGSAARALRTRSPNRLLVSTHALWFVVPIQFNMRGPTLV